MIDIEAAVQRVTEYLDAVGAQEAVGRWSYADEVHVFNGRPLLRSDLRALVGYMKGESE